MGMAVDRKLCEALVKINFGDRYQFALISLGVVSTGLFGYFFYQELFPEYKLYQNAFVSLEKFRSEFSGEPPAPFKEGIKQLVREREDKGPAKVERCISCHVALQISDYSSTKLLTDINGSLVFDEKGNPVKVPNENYIWSKLDYKIADLKNQGDEKEAERLAALKTVQVGEYVYDMTRVLSAHPLMGRETRPFEYHPLEEYGCIACHNGNGQGLVTDKAHGPVFDESYEAEHMGYKPQFLERDDLNDPPFSKVFNDKPGHKLLFQTSPLYVGALIEAKCVQCHLTASEKVSTLSAGKDELIQARMKQVINLQNALKTDQASLTSLNSLKELLRKNGYGVSLGNLEAKKKDYSLSTQEVDLIDRQIAFLKKNQQNSLSLLEQDIKDTTIALTKKEERIEAEQKSLEQLKKYNNTSLAELNHSALEVLRSDIDLLTLHYQRGQELFVSQACYACHRVAGYARGGVGPELSQEGKTYPWFIKESMVWPQADLKTSTMPNYRLDHDELEDLMTYLLAQRNERVALAPVELKTSLARWDAGAKMPWEKPVPPDLIHNLDYSMTVFATEGCAACHRLNGFESNVGFAKEKSKISEKELLQEKAWFQSLFPEHALGSDIVKQIKANAEAIDTRLASNIRKDSLLEKIEQEYPGLIASFYAPFKYAERAEKDDKYQERLHKVLMMFVQEYGLGRQIGPKPNWSGVYRSDEWLMDHFKNPQSTVARSIMPIMPFDVTKFYALTSMLNQLGKLNRDQLRALWDVTGFNPEVAYKLLCAQCHGDYLEGNGPVSQWIYPIPKNLRGSDFLRNLTRERVINALQHGVKGTPMPPWGEVGQDKLKQDQIPVLTEAQIDSLTDWLFSFLPGGEVIRESKDVPKWEYRIEDVIEELKEEGFDSLKPHASLFPQAKGLIAALDATSTQEPGVAVGTLFNAVPGDPTGPDPVLYYIKKEYYTPENIAEGQRLFWDNCASCHGKEADGSGLRAEAMYDAKPRMLTNLNWIDWRDDLRLLRSIKYGVAGTSMQPWGDVTNGKQRLQMVIFIRSLTESAHERSQIVSSLYNSYDVLEKIILEKRVIATEEKKPQQEPLLNELSTSVAKEKEIFQSIGFTAMTQLPPLVTTLKAMIELNKNNISLKDRKLVWNFTPQESEAFKKLSQEADATLKEAVERANATKQGLLAQVDSEQKSAELSGLQSKINSLDNLRRKTLSGFKEIMDEHAVQQKIIQELGNVK